MSLKLKGLALAVGAFRIELESLNVEPGSITVLMGRSGSGKSSLLHAIAGFLPLERGSVEAGGTDVTRLRPEQRRIALVFQRAALFPHLTVRSNVEFALSVRGVPGKEKRDSADSWMRRVGILELAERMPHQISGGQAQRVALARAWIAGFPVCLLDEPFASLDVGLRGEMRVLLRRLVDETGVASLLVSHDPDDAALLADRVAILREGKLAWTGTRDAFVAERPAL